MSQFDMVAQMAHVPWKGLGPGLYVAQVKLSLLSWVMSKFGLLAHVAHYLWEGLVPDGHGRLMTLGHLQSDSEVSLCI